MRGYPRGPLAKQDYENLLAMPEYAGQATMDLVALAVVDDSKITIDEGTIDAPKLTQIDNPLPAWKRAGYTSKEELTATADDKIVDEGEVEILRE